MSQLVSVRVGGACMNTALGGFRLIMYVTKYAVRVLASYTKLMIVELS